MKQSIHARRMARKHRQHNNQSKLNLVSLMDIFTIIVFFLLMNSSDVEVLQNDKTIQLPESVSEQIPEATLIVRVNSESVLVGGRLVANVDDILAGDEELIAALTTELNYQAARSTPLTEEELQIGRAVTIMGDQSVPYSLLKKIMTTCAAAEYRNIALAVTKIAADDTQVVDSQGEGGV